MFRASSCSTVAMLCLAIAGCVPSRTGSQPTQVIKDVLASFSDDGATSNVSRNGVTSEAQKTWKEFFASSDLVSLIEAGLKNNQELNFQLQELIISQNEITARQG